MAQNSLLTTYLIPSGIIVFVIAYFFTQLQKIRNSKEDLRSKRLTLIEKLTTDATRINNLFESLRNDAEINGYFAFKNLNTINPMVVRIQSITTDEIVIFEEGDKLRKEIIDIGDFLSSFLTDVNTLEQVAQNAGSKIEAAQNNFDDELKNLRATVLPYGLQITSELTIVNPNGKSNEKHYNAALSALAEISTTSQKSKNDSYTLLNTLKDRRFFYSIKCLDSQNRLRIFISLLDEAFKQYNKRSWSIKLLNRVAL